MAHTLGRDFSVISLLFKLPKLFTNFDLGSFKMITIKRVCSLN